MSNYRRVYLPGGTYFFTVVTRHRVPVFTTEERVEMLRQAFRKVMTTRPFAIDAMVVLPDTCTASGVCRIAMLITLPVGGKLRKPYHARSAVSPTRVMSGCCGSADFGSMLFEIKQIGASMWITSITTR